MSSPIAMGEKLPPITSLFEEINSGTQASHRSQYPRASFEILPGPRTQHSFPEAQSLAPTPLNGRGRSSFSSPHGPYPSESTVSSEYPDRRGNYASGASSAMPSARGSPILPPVHSLQNSHGGGPVPPEFGRDPRGLPVMYNQDVGGLGAGSPPARQSSHSRDYADVRYTQDYMGQYASPPSYGNASNPGSYPMGAEMSYEGVDGKQKRRRGNLPKHITDILRTWFNEHVAHPYPTEDEKQQLMSRTGLSLSQISNWFINARRRNLPQLQKQAQTESDIRDGSMSLRQD